MSKLAIRSVASIAFILHVCFGAAALAEGERQCLKIGISNVGVTGKASGELTLRIFQLAQLCAEVVMVPQYRVSVMEEKGALDGDAWRVPAYFESHPFLVRVPTAVDHFSGSLYWRKGAREPSGPDATIGILLGTFWAKQALKSRGVQIYEANSYDQLFRLTESGHIQGFAMPSFTYRKTPHPGLDAVGLAKREIYNAPVFLALNRHHEAILPALDAAIRQLSAEGVITQMLSIDER